jgi:hypothetical protein
MTASRQPAATDLAHRRYLLFTMLTACAWRDSPAGPAPDVAGLRQYLLLTRYDTHVWRATHFPRMAGSLVGTVVSRRARRSLNEPG